MSNDFPLYKKLFWYPRLIGLFFPIGSTKIPVIAACVHLNVVSYSLRQGKFSLPISDKNSGVFWSFSCKINNAILVILGILATW